LKDRN